MCQILGPTNAIQELARLLSWGKLKAMILKALAFGASIVSFALFGNDAATASSRPNVLFICADDLKPTGPLNDDQARALIHGYHAAVSFVDAQIGRVLDELDQLGLAKNTIIVLWGDH